MPSIQQFTTARMSATRIRAEDFDDLARLHGDERVMATLGGVISPAETRARLAAMIEDWERNGFGVWTFRMRDGGRFAGRAGLRRVNAGGRDKIELLYAVAAEFWSGGYATEMARAILKIAFEQLDIAEVVAFTLPANRASRRVMEKAGLRYERDITWANLRHVLYRIARNPPR
jgi:ribosomal-protein-alanine N-acetyltransferase